MKNRIKEYLTEFDNQQDLTDDTTENDDDDLLADVRSEANGRLLTPGNIAILLVVAVIAFFGGYFAAFAIAHKKNSATEAELSACRRIIETGQSEISMFKDSVDVLNRRIAEILTADSISSAGQTQTW